MDATQNTIYYAILSASILIGIILVFFILVLIRNHRRTQKLHRAKILAEITTLENERKRIAADLHDELGPVLAGIKMKLNSITISDPEEQDILDKAMTNIHGMISKLKEISNDLMPTILIKKGLGDAVEALIDDISRKNEFQIQFTHQEIPLLTEQMSINIYRIIQELIHNTIKHSGAKRMVIGLSLRQQTLVLQTSDDGKGFDYHQQMKNNLGLGLRNLLSRTEMIGGNMYIETKKGEGTKYSFEIPV